MLPDPFQCRGTRLGSRPFSGHRKPASHSISALAYPEVRSQRWKPHHAAPERPIWSKPRPSTHPGAPACPTGSVFNWWRVAVFLRFRLAAGDGLMCGGSSNGRGPADTNPQRRIAEKTKWCFLRSGVEPTSHADNEQKRRRLKMRQMTFRSASPARADGRLRRLCAMPRSAAES